MILYINLFYLLSVHCVDLPLMTAPCSVSAAIIQVNFLSLQNNAKLKRFTVFEFLIKFFGKFTIILLHTYKFNRFEIPLKKNEPSLITHLEVNVE